MNSLVERVVAFRNERNWGQYHNPKDLALALSVEAAELLENFQWKSSDEAVREKRVAIEDELGDVLIYALFLCHAMGIDPADAVLNKLDKNAVKYPVEKAYGSNKKYTEF